MLDSFINILSFNRIPLALLGIVFFILSFYWNKLFTIFNLKTYQAVQRVHEDEIFRLSGFVIYLFFTILYLFHYFDSSLMINILISSIPFVIIGLKEDLLHNTSPKSRLISMIMSCLIFFYINPITFPVLDIPLLGALINFYPISIIFFTFSALVVMNGMNLIDGMNGLFGFTALFLLLAISIIALKVGDLYIMEIAILFASPLIVFLLFNFPFGKVFMGDLGAYLYGFVIAILMIYLFGKYESLLSWYAILILFYPCIELLFSFTRKVTRKLDPFVADDMHLHSVIYKILFRTLRKQTLSNFLTTLSLCFYWLILPLLNLFIILRNTPLNYLLLIFLFIILVFSYHIGYRIVLKKFRRL